MVRCPITYDRLKEGEADYSRSGLRRLSPRLEHLSRLELSSRELVREAALRAAKMSIGGVQPKVSARLHVSAGTFRLVDTGGRFILKPQNPNYANVPENEDLTMKLASEAGIDVPTHALVWTADAELCYAVRRFDRTGRNRKMAVEDFAQLQEKTRDTKYDSSLERVAATIEKFCTFPALEKIRLFRRVLFSFLTGNEDMHIKNYSLIRTADNLIQLSPAYDLLNSSIYLDHAEESALPVRGKKSKLTRGDLFDYFAYERLKLADAVVADIEVQVFAVLTNVSGVVERSFLPEPLKEAYITLVAARMRRMARD